MKMVVEGNLKIHGHSKTFLFLLSRRAKKSVGHQRVIYGWFHNNFVPYVRRKKKSHLKMEQKALLLLYNTLGHPIK
jgi:hypothetical protein